MHGHVEVLSGFVNRLFLVVIALFVLEEALAFDLCDGCDGAAAMQQQVYGRKREREGFTLTITRFEQTD